MEIESILDRGLRGKGITREEAKRLIVEAKPGTKLFYDLIHDADSLSRRSFNNRGEVHAQVGVNLAPCPKNCGFCAFAEEAQLFKNRVTSTADEVVKRARDFESQRANVIYLMSTADYPFDDMLVHARNVRAAISERMPLVANIGDFNYGQAKELLDAGFTAAYHVCRLREGVDTSIEPLERLRTIEAAKKAGLDVCYCVEPIGPEHSADELVEAIFRGLDLKVQVHATMRRIPVRGTRLFSNGTIREVEQAKITAITRLVMGDSILAMGVHEPSMASLLSGSNYVYAEVGPNPRDVREETSMGRGRDVVACKQMLWDAGFETFDEPAISLAGPLRGLAR